MQDDFRVGIRVKLRSELFQIGAKLLKVVDFAVKNNPRGSGRIMNRLLTAGKVDNRKPAHRQPDVSIQVKAVFVGTAMPNRPIHFFEDFALRRT